MVDVFNTEEVGIAFSLVCAVKASLVPLTDVFNVLKATTAVEYSGMIVGGMTVRVCNGADAGGCAEVADVVKSDARGLVDVKVLTVTVSDGVLDVEISGASVVLPVEVFKTVVGSMLDVPRGTLRAFDVVSVVLLVANVSREGKVLIPGINLGEVGDMSMLTATEEFELMDDGVTVALKVVIIVLIVALRVNMPVVGSVMILGVEATDLGGNEDVFIDLSATGMVEVVLGLDNGIGLYVVTVVKAVLLGSGGKDFVWLIVVLRASVAAMVKTVLARVGEVTAVGGELNSGSVTGGLIPE